jgi:hypothetical protein
MRAATAAIIGAFLAGGVQQVSGQSIANPYAHVRAMQKEGAALLSEGMAHSPSFRRLVNRIEQSHVIVYIDVRPDMRPGVGGSLRFLAESATDRFLRIQLSRSVARLWQVALLGHELQHAVEVAEAPVIHSAGDLRMLYRQIGVRTGADTYDSIAARQAGFTIREEIARARGDVRYARSTPVEPMPEGESIGEAEPVSTATKPAEIPAAAAPADSVTLQERD